MPWRLIGWAGAAIVFFLVALGRVGSLVVDWAWFSTVGYVEVFWTVFATKAMIFAATFAVSVLLLWVNAALALRFASPRRTRLPRVFDQVFAVPAPPGAATELLRPAAPMLPWRAMIIGAALVLGFVVAISETTNWDLILRFIYQVPYGRDDPLFHKDVGFYLFSLPVYIALKNWMLWILVLSALMAGTVYFAHGQINLERRPWRISSAAIAHGSTLLGLYFAIKAGSYLLDRYLLLYDDNDVVVGAGYADIHVGLPGLWILVVLAAAAAIAAWTNVQRRRFGLVIAAAALVLGGSFVFTWLVPAVFERFYVKPSELQLETPYLKRSIDFTRDAYNLRQITVKPFPAEEGLSFQALQDNRGTIDNIRLWDWQPLMDTYAQLQEIRTYYKFYDVDVDRYHLSGSYQQVTLAARELAPSLLSANAQTWVNLHLLFTHGNGVVMSPVTREIHRRIADFLSAGRPARRLRRPADYPAADLFWRGHRRTCDCERQHARVRLPQGERQRLHDLRRADGVPIGTARRDRCSPGISATPTSC